MKYLIASHGKYALGLKNASYQISGTNKEIYTITAYLNENTLQEQFEEIINKQSDDKWIILTDIIGGSVNQYVMNNYNDPTKYKIVAGINLYLLQCLLNLDDNDDLDLNIKNVINYSQNKTCYVNDIMKERRDIHIKNEEN